MKKHIAALTILTVILLAVSANITSAEESSEKPIEENNDVNTSDINKVDNSAKEVDQIIGFETAETPVISPQEQMWLDIERDGEQESGQWLKTDAENIAVLVKDVNENSIKELMVLRKIAKKDKAENTVEAIDKLISIRSQRYQQITEKAKDEKRQRLLQQREERRNKAAERRGSSETRTTERPARSRRAPVEQPEMQ